jgi:hypothetical protein
MTSRFGDSFSGSFKKTKSFDFGSPESSFSRSYDVPGSHGNYNRQSSYLRWLRGFEIAQAIGLDSPWYLPFFYELNTQDSNTQQKPQIPGVFVGFPTPNKELGMHWTAARLAGSLRTDNLRTTNSNGLKIEYTELTDEFITIKLEGEWGEQNPLPAPFFIDIPNAPQYPLIGEIFEDRIIEENGELITRDTLNETTGLRYGYVSAVLAEVRPYEGILRFRRPGSVWTSPDRVLVSPASTGFQPGRWLSTGARYCCSCQDFLGRDYAWISRLQAESAVGRARGKYFPYTKARQVKIGKTERVTFDGSNKEKLRAQIKISENPSLEVVDSARDLPGVFEDFGSTYTNNNAGPPVFNDYKVDQDGNVIYESNFWTQTLDTRRYCKHIYALKFSSNDLVPEPSDYPIGVSLTEIEHAMIRERKKTQDAYIQRAEYGVAFMDIPPYNAETEMMFPVVTKLFNLPSSFIKLDSFLMQDPISGETYRPGESPGM